MEKEIKKGIESNGKSCANCKWVGCRNYGWENRLVCINHIKE